jgi:hypothetical protein
MWCYFLVPMIATLFGFIATFNDYSHGNGEQEQGDFAAA